MYTVLHMLDKQPTHKYHDALSRNLSEGGYTFLHRVFKKNIDSGKPVVINTGNMYFQYHYEPNHSSFAQGITLLEGDDEKTRKRFMDVVSSFDLDVAISEGGYVRNQQVRLEKAQPGSILKWIKRRISFSRNNNGS